MGRNNHRRSRSKRNSFFNKYKLYFIFLIFIIVIVVALAGIIKNITGDKNTDDGSEAGENITDTITSYQGLSSSDIPLVLSDDGVTPVVPGCVINGAESLYADSYIISNPDDKLAIVNKKYNLSSSYAPQDLVTVSIPFSPGRTDDVKQMRSFAAYALSEMCAAAEFEEGYILYGASGYRSYNTQMVLFNKSVESKGSISEANKLTALAGQSEHQLGLAMDLSIESLNYRVDTVFGETEEGIWLKKNAHRFGFILRYPKEKEHITGYSYEPWHFRYVGKEAAEYIYENDLTLEEFYGLY
ncbi:MAG: M15 family metallopeptidase [Firmicutes bacterium]|nr:D-alanyl-D-alanine carboxypeptidase family protein [Clostridiales bacterium]MBQ4339852.1 M15 family metallopeptidase [Bacillota bacterium]